MTAGLLLYALLFKWMLASVGCMLAGLALYASLNLAARRWPVLLARRGVWLAAQAVVAAVALLPMVLPLLLPLLLPMLPHGVRMNIAPVLTLTVEQTSAVQSATQDRAPIAAAVHAAAGTDAAGAERVDMVLDTTVLPALATPLSPALWLLPLIWAVVYFAGLALALARWLRARRLWGALLAASQRLTPDQLRSHGAFSHQQLRDIA